MGANPITPEVFAAYRVFVAEQQREFRRISAATKGEHSAEDVSQEALLTACALQADRGMAMRFADAGYRKLLLSHLYQHFVRYTETTVRRALRCRRKHEEDNQFDYLADNLPADEEYDPLHRLCASEGTTQAESRMRSSHRQAPISS